jgi:hypothetical protein
VLKSYKPALEIADFNEFQYAIDEYETPDTNGSEPAVLDLIWATVIFCPCT